jgi:hypothetical protein
MYLARKMLNGTWVSTRRVGRLGMTLHRHPSWDACTEPKADRVKPGRRLCLLLQLHRGATRPGGVAPVRAPRRARL